MPKISIPKVSFAKISTPKIGMLKICGTEIGALEIGALEIGALEIGAAEVGVINAETIAIGATTSQPQLVLLQDLVELFSCDLLHGIIVLYSVSIITLFFHSGHPGCRINQGKASGVNLAP